MTSMTDAPLSVRVLAVGVPAFRNQLCASGGVAGGKGGAVSPKIKVPTVRLPSSVTLVSPGMLRVLKSAMASVLSGIPPFQLEAADQVPPAVLVHTDAWTRSAPHATSAALAAAIKR